MQPVLEIGDSLVSGKIRLYNDRLEFELRTRHAVVPINQISGVSTDRVGARKLRVFTKTGALIEAELTTMNDYDLLSEGILRIQAGETLGPDQLIRERQEAAQKEIEQRAHDANVRSCGLVVVVVLVLMTIVGLIVSAVGWVINTIGSFF